MGLDTCTISNIVIHHSIQLLLYGVVFIVITMLMNEWLSILNKQLASAMWVIVHPFCVYFHFLDLKTFTSAYFSTILVLISLIYSTFGLLYCNFLVILRPWDGFLSVIALCQVQKYLHFSLEIFNSFNIILHLLFEPYF